MRYKEDIFMIRMVNYWNRQPREVIDVPSLEIMREVSKPSSVNGGPLFNMRRKEWTGHMDYLFKQIKIYCGTKKIDCKMYCSKEFSNVSTKDANYGTEYNKPATILCL